MAYPADKETIKTDWATSDAPGYAWGNTIGRLLNEIQDLLGVTGTPVAGSFTHHKGSAHQVDTASTDSTKDKHVSNALAKGWEDHKALTSGNPHSVTKTDVGLGSVTNDAQVKKISSSTANRIAIWDGTDGNLLKVGEKIESDLSPALITINEQTGTSYTLVIGDALKLIDCNNADPFTLTIPLNSSVEFAIGTQVLVRQKGAGKATIVGADGVTLQSAGSRVRTTGQHAVGGAIQMATNVWLLLGDLEATT